jgi:hypothetical protein
MRRLTGTLFIGLAITLAGCGFLGASEITVSARNDSDLPMIVQVIGGIGGEGEAYGPPHTVAPLEERDLELAVPGGDWTVTVNGARLMESLDAGARRGRLPVTLIVPAPDDPIPGPYWESPGNWSDARE